jgi:hypothetical protein
LAASLSAEVRSALGESEGGREVNGDGHICLVKLDGVDDSVAVDVAVAVVHAEAGFVGGLAIDRSPISADLSESEIGSEVNDDGDLGLVKHDDLGVSVIVDVVVVDAEAEPYAGVYTVDVLVGYGA